VMNSRRFTLSMGLPLGTRCASLPPAQAAAEGTGRSLGRA
jgi:hypothetical protein